MKTTKIICDGCGSDVKTTRNIEDYRLSLIVERKSGYGTGVYTAMYAYPAIKHDCHFCDLDCLDLWRAREKRYADLLSSDYNAWTATHSTQHAGYSTHTPPSDDMRNAWKEDARKRANEEFPFDRQFARKKC